MAANRSRLLASFFALAVSANLAGQQAPPPPARPAGVPDLPPRGPVTISDADKKEILDGIKAPAGFQVTVFGAPPIVNYPTCVTASGAARWRNGGARALTRQVRITIRSRGTEARASARCFEPRCSRCARAAPTRLTPRGFCATSSATACSRLGAAIYSPLEGSMMPPGLADSLTLQEFASLLAFLSSTTGK